MFSAAQFKTMRVATTTKYFQQDLLCVKMNPIVNQLKEVIVKTFSNINALSLGIISNSQKKYTAAGRKLRIVNDLIASASMSGMTGGSISADPLLILFPEELRRLKKK